MININAVGQTDIQILTSRANIRVQSIKVIQSQSFRFVNNAQTYFAGGYCVPHVATFCSSSCTRGHIRRLSRHRTRRQGLSLCFLSHQFANQHFFDISIDIAHRTASLSCLAPLSVHASSERVVGVLVP